VKDASQFVLMTSAEKQYLEEAMNALQLKVSCRLAEILMGVWYAAAHHPAVLLLECFLALVIQVFTFSNILIFKLIFV
jgi:hypothetical protein